MKISYFLLSIVVFAFMFCKQDADGRWESIFNGKDLDGWAPKFTGQEHGKNYLNTFRVEDGKLTVNYKNYDTFDNNFGHLFYLEKLSSYRLRLEYRFIGDMVPGAPSWAFKNSGIKNHSIHPSKVPLYQGLLIAVEAQILGGEDGQ